jgi:type IV fimbrial biogenesis protein FimT
MFVLSIRSFIMQPYPIARSVSRKQQRRQLRIGVRLAGFTLTELMVTLTVSGILLSVAVPALSNVTVSSKLTSLANSFLANMYHARSEAIKRNGRAVLCKSASGAGCASSGGWHQGWIMFHDANDNAQQDDGEAVLLVQSSLPSGFYLTGNDPVSDYVSYAPTGAAKKAGGAFQAGTLTLCEQSSLQGRKIILSITGRGRIEKTTVASCS